VRELLEAWTRVRAFEEAAFVAELKKKESRKDAKRKALTTCAGLGFLYVLVFVGSN
jgi:hypothetical protein